MKKILLIIVIALFYAAFALAQAPQGFKYQTVVRNSTGDIMSNQWVSISLEILQGNISGPTVCSEIFSATTNTFGLVNLDVGSQDPSAFSAIDWANGPFFIRVSLNGSVMGTSQLLSVPYALYAEKAGNAGGGTGPWSVNGSNLYYMDGNVGIGTSNPNGLLDIRGANGAGGYLNLSTADELHELKLWSGHNAFHSSMIGWPNTDNLILSSGADGVYTTKMAITGDGKVGIGTSNPDASLDVNGEVHIRKDIGSNKISLYSGSADFDNWISSYDENGNRNWLINMCDRSQGNRFAIFSEATGTNVLNISTNGNVGIGTSDPGTTLHVAGDVTIDGGAKALRLKSGGVDHTYLEFYADSDNPDVRSGYIGYTSGGQIDLKFRNQIDGGNISFYPGLGGTVSVPELTITGGSDLAEPFPIANQLEEGTVVIIDESNPGHLIESNQPYDKRVAGIVSGAGGIEPGLTLKQEGIMEGTQNIALTGRVYMKATTENGAIRPGDRLTTSSNAGHAMKATDDSLSPGSVIGKAMSSLEEGEGLVLVLVNLQ